MSTGWRMIKPEATLQTSQSTPVLLLLAHAHEADLRRSVPVATEIYRPSLRVRLGTLMVNIGTRLGGPGLRPASA